MRFRREKLKPEMPIIRTADTENQGFSDRLDVLKFAADVHSNIKKTIKQDITLACLEEKDKKFVINMTRNAYFAQRMIELAAKSKKLSGEEKEYLEDTGKTVFDSLMIPVTMVLLTSRNVKNNYLIEQILGTKQDLLTEEEPPKPDGKEVVKKVIRGEE